MERMADHGNGIALLFARTDTAVFHKYVFKAADSILFVEGRFTFYDVTGKPASANSGGPSALIAYGGGNVEALMNSGIEGMHFHINPTYRKRKYLPFLISLKEINLSTNDHHK
jgi:hypothetical protein